MNIVNEPEFSAEELETLQIIKKGACRKKMCIISNQANV